MTDRISELMYEAAVTQAEQIAVNEMNRDAARAKHERQAMDLVAPPHDAACWPEPQPHHQLDEKYVGEWEL